jgi:hypothetical protein
MAPTTTEQRKAAAEVAAYIKANN